MADEKYHPDGIFAAAKDLHKPLETWRTLLTPEEQADVDLEDKAVPAGLGGARPPGWDDLGGGQPIGSIHQVDSDSLRLGRPEGKYYGDYLPHGMPTPIGPVPGFPETGKASWRGSLDDQMTIQADAFNRRRGLKPGDPLYATPQLAKSWSMSETGGDAAAFIRDPLQANTKDNWYKAKADLGLVEGQPPGPMTGIGAALEWMAKNAPGARDGTQNMRDALKTYRWGPKGGNYLYSDAILGRAAEMQQK